MFNKDIRLTGKHGIITKKLVKDGLFERNIDVYMCGAAIGIKYNLRAERDKSLEGTNILMNAFQNEMPNCLFLYQLVMLLADTDGITNEERINRAFMTDYEVDSEENQKNMDLFNSYVRGGIEKLQEMYDAKTKDELFEEMYNVLKRNYNSLNDKDVEQEILKYGF